VEDSRAAGEQVRRIGTIASRHEMPVDEYVVESVTPGQSAYDQIYEALSRWLLANPGVGRDADKPLEVYYSGLTEATLAVADALHNYGCVHTQLMRYDIVLQEYEPLRRSLARCTLRAPAD
jgi:hypothetical protein